MMPYYVYIVSNVTGSVLYTGVTGDLIRRISEHRQGKGGFSRQYKATRLVYYEDADEVASAIEREKQIKGGSRRKKLDLIRGMNPERRDLDEEIPG